MDLRFNIEIALPSARNDGEVVDFYRGLCVYYKQWLVGGVSQGNLTVDDCLLVLERVEPPVPIPNTEVKRPSADDTEGATPCGKYATPEA